jgi:hypothetical protein
MSNEQSVVGLIRPIATTSDGERPVDLRQWYPVKTTTDKLAMVFQHIADNDGRVELVHHVGGRDYLVCYSKPVTR